MISSDCLSFSYAFFPTIQKRMFFFTFKRGRGREMFEEGGAGRRGRGGYKGRGMHLKLGGTTLVYSLADCRSRLVYACIEKKLERKLCDRVSKPY